MTAALPLLSIVVCTYNRAAQLRGAVGSLFALETASRFAYEIVAIDNGSTDATAEVLHALGEQSPVPFTARLETEPGVAAARNAGVRAARGEWIAFFDDDQLADPRWLLELFLLAEENQVRCVGGRVDLDLTPRELANIPPACRKLLGESRRGPLPMRYPRHNGPGTGNLMIHREVFERVGLFDATLAAAGEDTDLFHRLHDAGYVAWYAPSAVVRHLVPLERATPLYFRTVAQRHGIHIARADRLRGGRLRFACWVAARGTHTLAVHTPRWFAARLSGNRLQLLDACVPLWRWQAYARFAACNLAPRWFPAETHLQAFDFRAQRGKATVVEGGSSR